jgi:hypothetical protein
MWVGPPKWTDDDDRRLKLNHVEAAAATQCMWAKFESKKLKVSLKI